jgi:uncharacterized protein (TIGR02145 family)
MKTKSRIWIWHLIVMGLLLILTNGCKKQTDQGQPPVLTTRYISSVQPTTSNSGGNITNDGGATVTARGVCWSTAQNPTIADSKTTDGTGTGTFTSAITGLTATTTYYVKAYATNSAATSYGDELSFKTYTGTVTDVDGNVYNTITIGTQTWMAENLKTTKYLNGDLIGTTTPATLDISGELTPKYQWAYAGDEGNVAIYGRLYTWFAITDSRSVCPLGWHVPIDAEWTTLTDYLTNNGYGYQGSGTDIAKSIAATSGWTMDPAAGNIGNDQASNNSSGFTALPSGLRDNTTPGYDKGNAAWLWSSTERSTVDAYSRFFAYIYGDVFQEGDNKQTGHAVRCLKD